MTRFLSLSLRLLGLLLFLWSHDAQARNELGFQLAVPTLRTEVGAAGQLTPGWITHLAVNVNTGAAVFLGPESSYEALNKLVLLPELGYSFDVSRLHAFSAGLGVGFGGLFLYGALTPRFVVGALNDERALGVRTGVSLHAFTLLTLELSHQFLSTANLTRHDIGFTVGLDLGPLIFMLCTFRPG